MSVNFLKKRILVVDDEPDIVELIKINLEKAGYHVFTAPSGEKALKEIRTSRPDLIVLDVMMPELDGLEVCNALRRDEATACLPIIMLSAKASEIDRIVGLELGADDYVTKPFSPRELILRVRRTLESPSQVPDKDKTELIQHGGLVIDESRHRVTFLGKRVTLTLTEFDLLKILITRKGRIQTRESLLRDIWEFDRPDLINTRTVDTTVRRLRQKLGKAEEFIDTVRGFGYRFVG